ncbi:tRNA uracil 4-sulfurtransferase ThiI [Amycolatopsis albispora]|uniref:tRNA uracil 4-sulfurtransferase ThiI n=1 Tax=Amycolatopsis albispora TaxID=1804986 RepID=UPI000DE2F43A|nr:tRNA uracil 4-sulfurtransferase ThiI [Amycolatopsis albispora]
MLKGRNRGWFERCLLDSLRQTVGERDVVRVGRRDGVLVLYSRLPRAELVERARRLPGISVVQPALRAAKTPEAAADAAVRLVRERLDGGPRRFAVRARRRDRRFPLTSQELAAAVGYRVGQETGWPVDLDEPEVEITVEVDRREVFVSSERFRGQGGLPVGSSGRALVLLSGGYDSPVAAYRAMRRGLRCEFVHFTGAPYTSPASAYKAYALVRVLSGIQGPSRLHVIPMGTAQRALATAGAGAEQVVAQRRLMIRAAARLAPELDAQALVTGDSLGQVASQTLSNLAAAEQGCELPLLRPLLGWDKEEIVAEARRIGTGEISALPDEDCCSLLAPPRVATRTTPDRLAAIDRRAGLDDLADQLVAAVQVLQPGEPGKSSGDGNTKVESCVGNVRRTWKESGGNGDGDVLRHERHEPPRGDADGRLPVR